MALSYMVTPSLRPGGFPESWCVGSKEGRGNALGLEGGSTSTCTPSYFYDIIHSFNPSLASCSSHFLLQITVGASGTYGQPGSQSIFLNGEPRTLRALPGGLHLHLYLSPPSLCGS